MDHAQMLTRGADCASAANGFVAGGFQTFKRLKGLRISQWPRSVILSPRTPKYLRRLVQRWPCLSMRPNHGFSTFLLPNFQGYRALHSHEEQGWGIHVASPLYRGCISQNPPSRCSRERRPNLARESPHRPSLRTRASSTPFGSISPS